MTALGKEILERLTRIEEQNRTQFAQLEKLDHAINGNGKPGIVSDVAELNRRLSVVEKDQTPSNAELALQVKEINDRHKSGDRHRSYKLEWLGIIAAWLAAVWAIISRNN